MSDKNHSATEVQHSGANLQEQLHAIINHEMEAFADVDKVAEVSELQAQVRHFMDNLQQSFDSYILEIERENAQQGEEPVATQERDLSGFDELNVEKNTNVMNLEEEFHTYGIEKANGITNTKRPASYTVIQSLIGSAIAVSLMWVFWPAADQQAVETTMVSQEKRVEAIQPVKVGKATETLANEQKAKTEAVAEAKPEAVAEAKPEAVAEAKPEAVVEAKPEAVVEAKPEAVVEAKPETVVEAKPETVVEAKPETVVEAKPETVVEAKPETVVESVVPKVKGEKIKVTAHFGNVRSAPDNSGKVVSRLKKGEVVYKLKESDGWYQVRLDGEATAWVHKSLFSPRLQVGVDVGNIRKNPTEKGEIVIRLKKGDYVTKVGEKKDWYQVKLDTGLTAWAHQSIF
ncbi:SH3 domain-containing protein [Mariprofundus aestuarium]|uniref:SH3 domain-containing protein n=1 Tax=Mariprofundus aestuarium TaxID=1921086 RepID=A0A2K8L1P9_MARES|nr:SH3 domain-containing protein [Mariprofundus aestuarium]ATX79751.1 SH3 domain-containing protein [Mariprofundus aestuarium]